MSWYFVFFFVSGFCSVLYELVWLRLSMAQFGVTTAMVSIVLSVFMAGLGLGSWLSGRWLRQQNSLRVPALRSYAVIEALIGVSGIVVPFILLWGRRVLENAALSSSFSYYLIAGLWVAATLIPWCTLMGATVPVAMRAIAQTLPAESSRSFSYLYMANVAGAVAGTVVPLFLIELMGFRGTLRVGVVCNCLIAISALTLSRTWLKAGEVTDDRARSSPVSVSGGDNGLLGLLFLTGLSSMAMEVVWVRRYTPYLGTVVYAFASILGVYLLATFIGSMIYRRWSAKSKQENPAVWIWLASFALLPLVAASPRIDINWMLRLVIGLTPFTGLLGFITPMLVDRFSGGDPVKAGRAYAVNVTGCIIGPLLAGFGLLPFVSERWALILLTLPWIIIGIATLRPSRKPAPALRQAALISLALVVLCIAGGKGYDENYPGRRVLRDSTATVIATGTGFRRQLLVNGYGMTSLTPITKVMAHLPLAFLDRPPQNALVICFGMGTTFRSLRSWGIPVTAVELVPSVPRLFGFYHSDADQVLENPLSHVVIDDGRRYLERTSQQYDVVTIDPPPPVEAAGSSMLYSKEFYQVVRRRLRPGGILQQWLPAVGADIQVVSSIARSLGESFPYVRTFWDQFGVHFLCSDQPIPSPTVGNLLQRMPATAVADFGEWGPQTNNGAIGAAAVQFDILLKQEEPLGKWVAVAPNTPALTDDRPINEYYVLRRWSHPQFFQSQDKEDDEESE